MTIFAINIVCRTAGFDYAQLGKVAAALALHEVMPGVWVCATELAAPALSSLIEANVGEHDVFFVAEIGASWMGGRINKDAALWLRGVRP